MPETVMLFSPTVTVSPTETLWLVAKVRSSATSPSVAGAAPSQYTARSKSTRFL